jgi:hypothetical protein
LPFSLLVDGKTNWADGGEELGDVLADEMGEEDREGTEV